MACGGMQHAVLHLRTDWLAGGACAAAASMRSRRSAGKEAASSRLIHDESGGRPWALSAAKRDMLGLQSSRKLDSEVFHDMESASVTSARKQGCYLTSASGRASGHVITSLLPQALCGNLDDELRVT